MRDFWVITAESSIKNIALHPYHRPELTFLSQSDTNGSLMWTMDDYVRQNPALDTHYWLTYISARHVLLVVISS